MNDSQSRLKTRADLRRNLRSKRRSLSENQQRLASQRLYHNLIHHHWFLRARRIAFYFANDGEIDPLALLDAALRMHKQCYLPVLSRHDRHRVSFSRFESGDSLQMNQWGIPEPTGSGKTFVSALSLDLVFVPLVGFDSGLARLGMGKGYYDRTFAFKRRSGIRRPRLIGLAHDCQRVEKIPVEAHDVRLNAAVTDKDIYT